MFFMIDTLDIVSYADDSTPYSVRQYQCDLERKLQKTSLKIFKWFHENGMKVNQDKCHFLPSFVIIAKFCYLLAHYKTQILKNFLV